MGVLKLTANNPRGVPHWHTVILPGSGCGPLKKRLQDSEGAPRERHVSGVSCRRIRPLFGSFYTKSCRVCAYNRRHGYQRGLRGRNHQNRTNNLHVKPHSRQIILSLGPNRPRPPLRLFIEILTNYHTSHGDLGAGLLL